MVKILIVVFWAVTLCTSVRGYNISEEHIASFVTSTMKMEAVCSSETLVTT
jgi:hypothetical protein